MTIRPLRESDWPAAAAVLAEGLASGIASFETAVPDWGTWDAAHRTEARLAAEDAGGALVGFAALAPVSRRRCYAGVAEVSVYVAERARDRGVGLALLSALVSESERAGVWTLQSAVFPENEASLRLHERCGFRRVGVRERIARRDGRWRDTVVLERRSVRAGVD